nr:MAG TPA: hypothetical protein [Bacteriophage sp.]
MTSECLFPNFSATCKLSHTACSFLRYTKSSITTLLSALQLFSELYKPMLQVFFKFYFGNNCTVMGLHIKNLNISQQP